MVYKDMNHIVNAFSPTTGKRSGKLKFSIEFRRRGHLSRNRLRKWLVLVGTAGMVPDRKCPSLISTVNTQLIGDGRKTETRHPL